MQDDSEKLRNELQNAELEMAALRTELRKALDEADRACAQMWLFFEHLSRRTETSPRPAADETKSTADAVVRPPHGSLTAKMRQLIEHVSHRTEASPPPAADETKSPADAVVPPPHETKSPADAVVPPPHETKSPADAVVRPPHGSLTAKMRQLIEHVSHRTEASPPPAADEAKSPADAAGRPPHCTLTALPAADVRPCVLHVEDNETSLTAVPLAAVRPYVLYIEDSEMSFGLVQQILQEMPEIDLHWADCGRTGLTEVQARVPDLILLDLDLPDMHGGEVLFTLQKDPATAGIPVIVISADISPSQIERMLAAGARDYLTKPFDIRRFLIMVEENLKGAAAGNGAAAWMPAVA